MVFERFFSDARGNELMVDAYPILADVAAPLEYISAGDAANPGIAAFVNANDYNTALQIRLDGMITFSLEPAIQTASVFTGYQIKYDAVVDINADLAVLGPVLANRTWEAAFTPGEAAPGNSIVTAISGGQWVMEDQLANEIFVTSNGVFKNITLAPGEGRLFRLRPIASDESWSGIANISTDMTLDLAMALANFIRTTVSMLPPAATSTSAASMVIRRPAIILLTATRAAVCMFRAIRPHSWGTKSGMAVITRLKTMVRIAAMMSTTGTQGTLAQNNSANQNILASELKKGADADGQTDILIMQAYPNPFNPTTKIRFSLPHAGEVTIRIFNLLGEEVRVWEKLAKSAGEHVVLWDSKDARGAEVGSGVYIFWLTFRSFENGAQPVVMNRKIRLVVGCWQVGPC